MFILTDGCQNSKGVPVRVSDSDAGQWGAKRGARLPAAVVVAIACAVREVVVRSIGWTGTIVRLSFRN